MVYLTEKAKEKARELSGRNTGIYLRLYIKGMG
jgi:Fe-S cluster assembly iron-binding protein IscA